MNVLYAGGSSLGGAKIIKDNLPGPASNCETLTKRPPAFYKKPLSSLAGTSG